jgi:hypothetical protein
MGRLLLFVAAAKKRWGSAGLRRRPAGEDLLTI